MLKLDQILKKTLLTEKAFWVSSFNTYILQVHPDATKTQIAWAVKTLFNVDVVSVNTSILRGQLKKRSAKKGKKSRSFKMVSESAIKKAYVKLRPGQRLPTPATGLPGMEGSSSEERKEA